MKNLLLENFGVVEMTDSEIKETNGGWFGIVLFLAIVLVAAIMAGDQNERTEVIVK